jgi:hypothetical protein
MTLPAHVLRTNLAAMLTTRWPEQLMLTEVVPMTLHLDNAGDFGASKQVLARQVDSPLRALSASSLDNKVRKFIVSSYSTSPDEQFHNVAKSAMTRRR